MRRRYEEITSLGSEIVAIGTGDLRYARNFIEENDIPYPVILDDDGEAARAASIRKASLLELVGPATVPAAARAVADGHVQGRTGKRGRQLGATFVVGPGDVVLYEYQDQHVGDHAPIDDVIAALHS